MGIAVVKTHKTSPLKAQGWKASGRNFWNGVALVAVVCVSMGMGIGIGWGIRPPMPPPSATPATPTQTPLPPARPTFLFIGDSLTELGGSAGGWAARLKETYMPSVDVLNRGRSGFNTKQTLDVVLPAVVAELRNAIAPVLITVWLGANDAALADGPNAGQHIPIDQYKTNLLSIVHALRQLAPLAKILLISPPVVDDATRRKLQLDSGGGASDPLDRTNAQAGAYALACGEVATAVGTTPDRVALLDLHSFLTTTYPVASDRAVMLSDGLHFSDAGNAVVYEQLKKQLEALLPASLIGP